MPEVGRVVHRTLVRLLGEVEACQGAAYGAEDGGQALWMGLAESNRPHITNTTMWPPILP